MKRLDQIALIASTLGVSWLAMQVPHELGHVIGAWLTVGHVSKVALHPLIFSRTELSVNRHPLVVVWAGPVIGVILPLFAWAAAAFWRVRAAYLIRFFAGLCLITNGVYIAFGPADGGADTGVMIQNGAPRWVMVVFGLSALAFGLALWNGQGRHFGLGNATGAARRVDAWVMVLALVVMVGLEWWFGNG